MVAGAQLHCFLVARKPPSSEATTLSMLINHAINPNTLSNCHLACTCTRLTCTHGSTESTVIYAVLLIFSTVKLFHYIHTMSCFVLFLVVYSLSDTVVFKLPSQI